MTDVGAELSFILPNSGAAQFPALFEKLEGMCAYHDQEGGQFVLDSGYKQSLDNINLGVNYQLLTCINYLARCGISICSFIHSSQN